MRKFGKFKLNVERKFEGFYLEDKNNPEIKHKAGIHKYVWKIVYEKKKKKKKKCLLKLLLVLMMIKKRKRKKRKKKKMKKNKILF